MRSRPHASRGFTIIELLIVIALIGVLLSILLPAISRVRDMSVSMKCQGNLRSLMGAFLAFAADHDTRLPGADRTPNPAPYQMDWLMTSFDTAPQSGTIWPYVRNKDVFLCPAMDTQKGAYAISNGRFDYGFFTIFNGTPIRTIKQQSQLKLLNGGVGWYPTPILCQEEGYQINGHNIEGNHSNVDQMSHIHNGGSYYAAIDGSVHFVVEPDVLNAASNGCHQWSSEAPSHTMVDLGKQYEAWGSWGSY